MLSSLSLLAQIPSTSPPPAGWTTKELVLQILIPLIGASVTIGFGIWKIASGKAKRRNAVLRRENNDLSEKSKQDEHRHRTADFELQRARELATIREGELDALKTNLAEASARMGELQNRLTDMSETEKELRASERLLARLSRKDGRTWSEKVSVNATELRRLDPAGRRTPIISVMNLKGGVGKTTVTANLAAAFAEKGYRVLLIDLDLQGSLSNQFHSVLKIQEQKDTSSLIGDFFVSSFEAGFPNLNDYTLPVLGGRSGLVATTDDLVYAEQNLTIRWFVGDTKRDPRLLLCKELQLKRITDRYDLVLIDCPPVLNVSCVNALSASDYLLAPVMLTKQCTDRLQPLLRILRDFHNINPVLKPMGIVANRTSRRESLTRDETNIRQSIQIVARDIYGSPVPVLDRFIPTGVTSFRNAEDENRCLTPDDPMFSCFTELAEEVESYLPTFCVRTPSALAVAVDRDLFGVAE